MQKFYHRVSIRNLNNTSKRPLFGVLNQNIEEHRVALTGCFIVLGSSLSKNMNMLMSDE